MSSFADPSEPPRWAANDRLTRMLPCPYLAARPPPGQECIRRTALLDHNSIDIGRDMEEVLSLLRLVGKRCYRQVEPGELTLYTLRNSMQSLTQSAGYIC